MEVSEKMKQAAHDMVAAQKAMELATVRMTEEVSRFVQTPKGLQELAGVLAGIVNPTISTVAAKIVADASNAAPVGTAPQSQPKPPKMPVSLGAAIHEWFPAAPQVVTVSQMLDILREKGWKFDPAFSTPDRQRVNHYLWTHRSTFKRVSSATYQRVR